MDHFTMVGIERLDLATGPVDEYVFFMPCSELQGVYLDYALSRCQKKYSCIEFTHCIGLTPHRVKIWHDFDREKMILWSPTTIRDQGLALISECLGRVLHDDETLEAAFLEILRKEFGENMELPGRKYRTA